MRYLLLINQGTTPTPGTPGWDELTEEAQGEVYAAYRKLNETPGVTPGERMLEPETATTVRVENGETLVTDGPYVETKEALGGYLFLDAQDLDAAIAVAAGIPAASMGGRIEIRPVGEPRWSSNAASSGAE